MKDNPVAKNAHKFNKRAAGPHKDKKRALKKGDRKHKGQYEENGNVDEVFTTTAISNFFKKSGDKKKYDRVVKDIKKGKYTVAKATQMFDLDGRILQSMVTEKLSSKDDAGDYVKDFRKSDAPQFKGKSDKKKQQMAIAAYLDAKDGKQKNEFFGRLGLAALGGFLQKKRDQKVDHPKVKSNLGLWDHKEPPMDEWACNTTEKTRRVKGGDKRKKYMKEKQIEEGEKKGLWDRIHAKRKRGEKPAKPGEKGYPKTLDVGEAKNTPGDGNPCWDTHKKVGTKMKNGKRVNDCVPKNESAQDRLDKMAAKHGLGKPNKAADDYMAKMRKKYGAKDDAELKRKMGMKEDAQQVDEISKTIKKAGQAAKTAATNAVIRPSAQAKIATGYAQAKDTAKSVSSGAKKVASGAKKVGGAVKKATGAIKKKSGPPNPVPKPKKANESMDPRDFTDKAGYLVTAKGKGKEEIKQFFHTLPSAKKYANRVNQGGNKATIYKTNGRDMMKEDLGLQELTKRDLERMEKRKKTNLVKRGKAKAEPKAKSEPKDRTYVSNRKGDDDHIVMQLRKAQDVKGNMDIKVSPTGKTVKLPIKTIDKLLATHDKLQKPEEKRKFRIMVTKELRKKAK
jgi:hypothetical protein